MWRNRNPAIILNLMVLFIAVSSASAAVHLVPDNYPTIEAAIVDCEDGDEIVVADGIYTGAGNCDLSPGRAITIRSENGPDKCIIDCNGTAEQPHRAFHLGAEQPHRAFHLGNNSRIVGFTIINGYADEGGAIYCEYNASPTIINCILTNNSAMRAGGAIYCRHSNLMIINCTINNNLAEAEGGWGRDNSYGGGVFCSENSNLTVIDSAICNNIAKGGDSCGGGIYFDAMHSYGDAKFVITNCTINGNSVEGGWASLGGGIYYSTNKYCPAPFTIINCTVNGNSAKPGKDRDSSYGGGISCHLGSPIISKCRISGNTATEGGGISCEQSSPVITGCIISGNSPIDRDRFSGGGIQCRDGNATINNCTIVGNSFWGVRCQNAEAVVTSSILFYNGNGKGDFYPLDESSATVTYSNVQMHRPDGEPWPGIGNINEAPCFVEPGYWDCNDRDLCFWVEGDYHLSADSPCIDAGHVTSYMLDDTDFDGNSRVSGSRIDMGAYEFLNTTPVANTGPNEVVYAWINGWAEVTLDGSACFDPDGDELSYLWNWMADGNTYDVNGVSPTIELPVGEHIINLTVNDGIEDSEPNQIVVTVIEALKSRLWIFPKVINRHSRQKNILAWLYLPEGVDRKQIDNNEPILLYPGEIKAAAQHVIQHGRAGHKRTSVLAFFDKAELMGAVADNGKVELQVTGKLKSGQIFFGNSNISIKGH